MQEDEGAKRYAIAQQADGHPTVILRGPDKEGQSVAAVPNNEKVEIVRKSGGSVLVLWEGTMGWARETNLKELRVSSATIPRGIMGSSLIYAASAEEEAADLDKQHELLNNARDGRWDNVLRMLQETPEHINVQPLKRDETRRYSVLHQAAEAGRKDILKFLLAEGADVTLTTSDNRTALDVAHKDVLPLLEACKPKPACQHGAACFIHDENHWMENSHPSGTRQKIQTNALKANAEFGPGVWELNVTGDVLDKRPKSWVQLNESFMGDAALYSVLVNKTCPKCTLQFKDVLIPSMRDKSKQFRLGLAVEVDFHAFSCNNIPRIGEGGEARSLALRRVSGSAVQFPEEAASSDSPYGNMHAHPFYKISAELKEDPNTWLTQDFFFRAFELAIKKSGGIVPADIRLMFNEVYNQDWFGKTPDECAIERRGGVLYRAPAGWKRFALDVTKYGPDKTWMGMKGEPGEWAVAYHGTSMDIIPLIVNKGFIVGSGQGAEDCVDCRTGTKVGKGIFCTPNLTTVECYANGGEDTGSTQNEAPTVLVDINGEQHTLFFALQCRVNPNAIRRPMRHFSINNDEEIMGIDGVFEWVINNPNDIRPYAILVRDKEGSDHRTLGELICPCFPDTTFGRCKWNTDHKPLPFGSYDSIPGRTVPHNLLQNSHMQATRYIPRV